jgi:hypothetical protein
MQSSPMSQGKIKILGGGSITSCPMLNVLKQSDVIDCGRHRDESQVTFAPDSFESRCEVDQIR